jgi:hypothetical protein
MVISEYEDEFKIDLVATEAATRSALAVMDTEYYVSDSPSPDDNHLGRRLL